VTGGDVSDVHATEAPRARAHAALRNRVPEQSVNRVPEKSVIASNLANKAKQDKTNSRNTVSNAIV
jgi:hypothetical protein